MVTFVIAFGAFLLGALMAYRVAAIANRRTVDVLTDAARAAGADPVRFERAVSSGFEAASRSPL